MRRITTLATHKSFAAAFALILMWTGIGLAQTTSFTYQGRLTDGGSPASGNYDLQFALFDTGGTQVGSTLVRSSVVVSGGIFTVQLDFGAGAFPGADRFLEIGTRPAGAGSFTILSPRQQITATPYALRSLNASAADTATNALQLGGVAASQYVKTTDSRLTDARAPTAGSTNYIQNSASQQTANFNISGNGFFGGSVGIGSPQPTALLEVRTTVAGQWGLSVLKPSGASAFLARYDGSAFVGGDMQINGRLDVNTFASTTAIQGTAATNGIALKANGSSWFRGDTTPLSAVQTGPGEGIVIGSVGGYGYIAAWDYGVFQSRNLVLNRDGGNVGINTNAPTLPLDVNGRARIRDIPPLGGTTGTVCFNPLGDLLLCGASSLKLKTNVQPFHAGLNVIRQLRPINFNWKADGRPDIGLAAEEVAQVAPSFVFTNDKGEATGVKYERLDMLLINAIKEQQEQIQQQRELIEQQQAQAVRQQQQLKQQEEQINQERAAFAAQRQELVALKKLVCRGHRRARVCR